MLAPPARQGLPPTVLGKQELLRECAANTGLGTGKAGPTRSGEILSLAQPGYAGSPCGASPLYHTSGQAPGLSTVAKE